MSGQGAADRRLVLATGNRHKVEELAAIVAASGLPLAVCSARSLGPAPEVVEDQDSFDAHALLKARAIAGWLRGRGEPGETLVLADDSGLCVAALDGAPGVDSAYYAGPQTDDAANNARLVAELRGRGLEESRAHYVCVLALTRVDGAPLPALPGSEPGPSRTGEPAPFGLVSQAPSPDVRLFRARWDGVVRTSPRGTGGFGYDPHFWPDGEARSLAELPAAEKNARSHRGQATALLLAALPAALSGG